MANAHRQEETQLAGNPHKLFDDDAVRWKYLEHYDSIRGRVRMEVVRRHLDSVVLSEKAPALRVLDVGCGDARDAAWLATLGHDVVAYDSSSEMLRQAVAVHGRDSGYRKGTLELIQGTELDAFERFGAKSFDLVLSHGVMMYHSDAQRFITNHMRLVKTDGVLSLLTKNADSLVHRAAREASLDQALQLLDDSQSIGHLGVETDAQRIQDISDIGMNSGATVRSWAGVRMFVDTPTESLESADDDKLVELEWLASRRDPHRHTAALLHVLLLKGVNLDLLPAPRSL